MTYDKELNRQLNHDHKEYAFRNHEHPEYDQSREIAEVRKLALKPVPYDHKHNEYATKEDTNSKLDRLIIAFEGLVKDVLGELDKQIKQIRGSIANTVESLSNRIDKVETKFNTKLNTKSDRNHTHEDLNGRLSDINKTIESIAGQLKSEIDKVDKKAVSKDPMIKDLYDDLKELSKSLLEYSKKDDTKKVDARVTETSKELKTKIREVEKAVDILSKIDKKDKDGLIKILSTKADSNHEHKEYLTKKDLPEIPELELPEVISRIPGDLTEGDFAQLGVMLSPTGHKHKRGDIKGLDGYLDDTYLRLDTSNDPLTGQLEFPVEGFIIKDSNNTRWTVTIDTDGSLVTTLIAEGIGSMAVGSTFIVS